MKYAFLFLFAVLTMVSCTSAEEVLEVPTPENTPQESVGYRFSINVGEPTTRVTYHDNIGPGPENSPYNPNADGSNKLTMSWRDGDELVAIRWKAPYNEYVVLKAEVAEGQETHSITFSAEDVAHFQTALEEGERFVLVHGDFVLDASHKTDGKVDPVIDFPTSQVSKDGYASHIHHGGVVDSTTLTFRNQDGTLENLRKHEYMVADCYVHMGEADASGNVPVTFSGKKDEYQDYVTMHIAHTLLRLTLFLPDEDFSNGGFNDDLIAVSLTDVDAHRIFHRYFRMHPNEKGETNYWKTSYNDNADHEENAYIRINLADEDAKKHGVSHKDVNVFGSDGFNPKKPVVVAGTVGGKTGHYFTLYFSLPSRHMGLEGQGACALKVSAFTRTHAYTTIKTYGLPDDAMQPGKVVPLNVSFVDNFNDQRAITDPELGFTFTPGFVYANKSDDGTWTYGVYQNQGQYAGMSHQTLDFGEYFTFGSKDPTQAYHEIGSTKYNAVVPSPFVDVAEQVEIGGVTGLCHMLTKAEAERIMARLEDEINTNGVFLGYYYYDDGDGNTKHKAPGSQQTSILNAAAAGGAKTVDELKAMSATVGIYVGRSTQPKFEEQDDYFFLPNAKQMNNVAANTMAKVQTCTDGSGNAIYYYIPKDYTDLDATGDNTKLTSKFSTIFKFSTWLRTPGTSSGQGYRMQVWTNDKGTAINWGSSNVTSFDGTFARPIRAVIY